MTNPKVGPTMTNPKVDHGRSTGTDKGSGSLLAEGELKFSWSDHWDPWGCYQVSPWGGLWWQSWQLPHNALHWAATTPENGVATANLGELVFVGKAGFTEGCNADFVESKFSSHEGRSAFWSTWLGGGYVEQRSNVPRCWGELVNFFLVSNAVIDTHQLMYTGQVVIKQAMLGAHFLALSSVYWGKRSISKEGCLIAQRVAKLLCFFGSKKNDHMAWPACVLVCNYSSHWFRTCCFAAPPLPKDLKDVSEMLSWLARY